MKKTGLAGALVLLAWMILFPVWSLAAETPWGRVKVVGYMDEDQRSNCNQMWAPQAVLTSKPHIDDMYLEYRYAKFDYKTRVWQLKLVDEEGKAYPYGGLIDIIFPYPCKWDNKAGSYWKWTKNYAERFHWAYTLGYSKFAYHTYGGSFSMAGYFTQKKVINPYVVTYTSDKTEEELRRDRERWKELDYEKYVIYEKLVYTKPEAKPITLMTQPEIPKEYIGKFKEALPNDEYGHRISLRAKDGCFSAVCIQNFEDNPAFKDCEVKAYLGGFNGYLIKVAFFSVAKLKGFCVDSRPKGCKDPPNFWTFLREYKSTL